MTWQQVACFVDSLVRWLCWFRGSLALLVPWLVGSVDFVGSVDSVDSVGSVGSVGLDAVC